MMDVPKLISSIEALGLVGNEFVVSRQLSGIYAVFAFGSQTPMVRAWNSGFAPYVFGKKNARRHVLFEANLANYPSIKQARADAMKVSGLLERLRWIRDAGLKSAGAEVLVNVDWKGQELKGGGYVAIQDVGIGLVPRAGRLELQSRGGVQVLILGVQ